MRARLITAPPNYKAGDVIEILQTPDKQITVMLNGDNAYYLNLTDFEIIEEEVEPMGKASRGLRDIFGQEVHEMTVTFK